MRKDIAVIFDFNGTCIFDGKYHNAAWKAYCEELTMQKLSEADVDAFIVGHTAKEILEHFVGYELSDSMVQQFSEEKERIYRNLIAKENLELAPGLETFLNFLLLAGIPKAIASVADLANMNMYFERYNLERWFKWENVVIGAGNIPLKPHPDLYLAAIDKLGVAAENCLVFEDSLSGVEAAYVAGVSHIIAVIGDSWRTELEKKPGVYSMIHDFTELNPENFA